MALEPCEHNTRIGCVACAIARALECSIGFASSTRSYELQFDDPARAALVFGSLGKGAVLGSGGVPVPGPVDSLLKAEAFGLIFRGQDGYVKGLGRANGW